MRIATGRSSRVEQRCRWRRTCPLPAPAPPPDDARRGCEPRCSRRAGGRIQRPRAAASASACRKSSPASAAGQLLQPRGLRRAPPRPSASNSSRSRRSDSSSACRIFPSNSFSSGRDESLGAGQGLLAHDSDRARAASWRLGDLDVVAEDPVEPDLEPGDAGGGALLLLQARQSDLGVARSRAARRAPDPSLPGRRRRRRRVAGGLTARAALEPRRADRGAARRLRDRGSAPCRSIARQSAVMAGHRAQRRAQRGQIARLRRGRSADGRESAPGRRFPAGAAADVGAQASVQRAPRPRPAARAISAIVGRAAQFARAGAGAPAGVSVRSSTARSVDAGPPPACGSRISSLRNVDSSRISPSSGRSSRGGRRCFSSDCFCSRAYSSSAPAAPSAGPSILRLERIEDSDGELLEERLPAPLAPELPGVELGAKAARVDRARAATGSTAARSSSPQQQLRRERAAQLLLRGLKARVSRDEFARRDVGRRQTDAIALRCGAPPGSCCCRPRGRRR